MLGKCDAVHSGVAMAFVAVGIVGLTIASTLGLMGYFQVPNGHVVATWGADGRNRRKMKDEKGVNPLIFRLRMSHSLFFNPERPSCASKILRNGDRRPYPSLCCTCPPPHRSSHRIHCPVLQMT